MNKENLLKMADYIETIPQEFFDMNRFRSDNKEEVECNSVGCIIGHCTILDKNNIEANYRFYDLIIDFHGWSNDFTGVISFSLKWEYLFGSSWWLADNTPTGAAKRIRYVVENGFPDNKIAQIEGNAPLIYNQ